MTASIATGYAMRTAGGNTEEMVLIPPAYALGLLLFWKHRTEFELGGFISGHANLEYAHELNAALRKIGLTDSFAAVWALPAGPRKLLRERLDAAMIRCSADLVANISATIRLPAVLDEHQRAIAVGLMFLYGGDDGDPEVRKLLRDRETIFPETPDDLPSTMN